MTSKLILGDCIEKMKELEANSIDAVITDPPYALSFMGKEWDSFRGDDEQNGPYTFQAFNRSWALEAFRVLKSGGFMFAMGGTRTHHRLTCGIEDAGFLIRDEIEWAYASGFPKAQDIASMIAKREGAKREGAKREGAGSEGNTFPLKPEYQEYTLTENAKQWSGWKTSQLKPSHEPIVIAQKPCDGSTTDNVLKYWVGGYNVDGCRIPYQNEADRLSSSVGFGEQNEKSDVLELGHKEIIQGGMDTKGRFPPNLLVQDEVLNDGKISSSSSSIAGGFQAAVNTFSEKDKEQERYTSVRGFDDEGQFSRYFSLDAWWAERIKHLPRDVQKVYPFLIVPKAAKGEKNEGLDDFDEKRKAAADFRPNHMEKALNGESGNPYGRWDEVKNIHPTCKPVSLMSYLITLATRDKAVVLDPFMGSGTTGIAAHCCGRDFIGIEKNEEYMKIAQARIGEAEKQTRLVF